MTVLRKPLLDTNLVVVEAGCDEDLGGVAIGIGGSSRYLALATETVTKFLVGATDMLLESVSAARFVCG